MCIPKDGGFPSHTCIAVAWLKAGQPVLQLQAHGWLGCWEDEIKPHGMTKANKEREKLKAGDFPVSHSAHQGTHLANAAGMSGCRQGAGMAAHGPRVSPCFPSPAQRPITPHRRPTPHTPTSAAVLQDKSSHFRTVLRKNRPPFRSINPTSL